MKKIIAAAVATAFVAPAFADVTVSGTFSEYLMNEKASQLEVDRHASETNININASTETNSGITVSGDFKLTQAGADYYGEGISLARSDFGKVSIGNPAGALDAVDDKAEVLELMDPLTGSTDAMVLWQLPTMVENLAIYASYSPKDGNADTVTGSITGSTIDYPNDSTGIADDESGLALQYTMGSVTFAYGQNDEASREATFAGVTYSANGLKVSYETLEQEYTAAVTTTASDRAASATIAAGTEYESKVIGVQYDMGDVSLRALTTSRDTDGTQTHDRTAYGIHYNLGGGATFIAEAGSEDKASAQGEFTGVGIRYKF